MLSGRRRSSSVSSPRRSSAKDDEFFGISKYSALLKVQQLYRLPTSSHASVLWERKSCGYRIIDLRLDKLLEALRFLPPHCFYAEPLCRAVALTDDCRSSKCYLSAMADKMSDLNSFCALAEGTGNIVGVAVASIYSRQDEFPYGITRLDGEAFPTMISLKQRALPESHICDIMNIDNFYYIDVICVEDIHQRRGIGTALVRSCLSRARELQVQAVVSHFTSAAAQTIAERLGFQTLVEIPYEKFDNLGYKDGFPRHIGFGNYSVAFMATLTEQPEYSSPPPSVSTVTTKRSLKTKRGKKKT